MGCRKELQTTLEQTLISLSHLLPSFPDTNIPLSFEFWEQQSAMGVTLFINLGQQRGINSV